MPDNKTDSNNYGRQSNESERDLAAKGGPATGLGNPDGKHTMENILLKLLTIRICKHR